MGREDVKKARTQLRWFTLIVTVLVVIIVPLLGRGILSAKASALSSTNLASPQKTLVIDTTDLFVTADGSTPKKGVDSISVSTIETLLNHSTNVELFTDSSTSMNGGDITITAPIAWSTAATLTVDAFHSIFIDAPITINNISQGGLNLITNDGGSGGRLAFDGGNINFASGSGNLTINGNPYFLISDLNGLNAINSHPGGSYALAHTLDASSTIYNNNAVVPTTLTGTFEGLGNTINHLTMIGNTLNHLTDGSKGTATIFTRSNDANLGLFNTIGTSGTVENLGITNANISSPAPEIDGSQSGVLAIFNQGTIARVFTTGTASTSFSGGLVTSNEGNIIQSFSDVNLTGVRFDSGGLVGDNSGTITQSYATGNVTGQPNNGGDNGGLVGLNAGTIDQSYATGNVTNGNGIGGLVGFNPIGFNNFVSSITNSYATGNVSGDSEVGGLVGGNDSVISQSYATGAVQSQDNFVGGLVGVNPGGIVSSSYWDTETTGQASAGVNLDHQGTPIPGAIPGATGLTTAQFQAGLPAGFDPTVWGYKKNSSGNNTGLPILLWQIVPSFAAGQPSAFETYIHDVFDIVKDNPQIADHALFGLSIALSGLPLIGTGTRVAGVALVEASEANQVVTIAETVIQREGAGVSFGKSTASQALRKDLADASANTLAEQECFVCTLKDTTIRGSRVKNFETNVTLSEFGQELIDSGYTAKTTTTPGVTEYIKGNTKYVLRSFSSGGQPTAEYFPNASVKKIEIKYRLLGP